jgi:hypothetical protein
MHGIREVREAGGDPDPATLWRDRRGPLPISMAAPEPDARRAVRALDASAEPNGVRRHLSLVGKRETAEG